MIGRGMRITVSMSVLPVLSVFQTTNQTDNPVISYAVCTYDKSSASFLIGTSKELKGLFGLQANYCKINSRRENCTKEACRITFWVCMMSVSQKWTPSTTFLRRTPGRNDLLSAPACHHDSQASSWSLK